MTSLTFMTVATNRYLDYWFELYKSYETQKRVNDEVYFQVFTDRPEDAVTFRTKISATNISIVTIPSYGWPEATLLRYAILSKQGNFENPGTYVHIDADMLFVDMGMLVNRVDDFTGKIQLVLHPGFYRPTGLKRLSFYKARPLQVLKDLYTFFRVGGLGAWETHHNSSAFVPYSKRSRYCCGGVWMGTRESFRDMCSNLAEIVQSDISEQHVGKWHDESYLNMFLSKSKDVEILMPEFCFVEGYGQLVGISPLIMALEKGSNRTR